LVDTPADFIELYPNSQEALSRGAVEFLAVSLPSPGKNVLVTYPFFFILGVFGIHGSFGSFFAALKHPSFRQCPLELFFSLC